MELTIKVFTSAEQFCFAFHLFSRRSLSLPSAKQISPPLRKTNALRRRPRNPSHVGGSPSLPHKGKGWRFDPKPIEILDPAFKGGADFAP